MKSAWLLGVGLAILIPAGQVAQSAQAYRPLSLSPMCLTADSETGGEASKAKVLKPPPMSDAFGNGAFKITANAEGQRWFNYGLQLAWAFNHEGAKAAFAEAVRLDPDCGMCAWGYAWSLGPTINFGISPEELVKAREAAMKAQALLAKGSDKDRALGDAIVARYAGKGDNKAFAKAMDNIASRFPGEDPLMIWAADAWMIDNQPARSMPLLEAVLARSPNDAGAIHFYIHASEWVGSPGKAETYADKLQGVAPGASHLIHMPSHTYYQIGRYKDAARANLDAIDVDAAWTKRIDGPANLFDVDYFGHNTSFALGGAMMAGDAAAALKIGELYRAAPAAKGPWGQAGLARTWFAYGRFAPVDRVLAMPRPDNTIGKAMWRYARGEALSRRGDAAGVRAEAEAMAKLRPALMKGDAKDFVAFLDLGQEILGGRAAMLENNPREAARRYYKASLLQEREMGESRDPPPWWYPIRRSYASALLASGQTDKALRETDKVLAKWPHDPLTLVVASRAEAAKGRADAADERMKQAGREWVGGSLGAVPAGQI